MEQIHNLRPSGRFLIEDKTVVGDHQRIISSSNNRTSQSDDNETVHPLVFAKTWVKVANDKVITKIMHRLREKVKENKTGGGNRNDGEKIIKNEEMEEAFSSNNINDMNENLAKLMKQVVDDSKEDESVGQYDDWFDDTLQEPKEGEGVNDVGQYDPVIDQGENFVRGQLDDVFDDTGDYNEATLEGCEDDVTSEQHLVHELTMQQWVIRCTPNKGEGFDTSQTSSVQGLGLKATLLMALKLTDFIIEAEKEEESGQGNPVPLESIVTKNVLIRARELNLWEEEQQTVIEHVWINSSKGENPNTGTVMARLYAIGNVLYELFAGEEFTLSSSDYLSTHHAPGELIKLEKEEDDDTHERKRRSTYSKDISSCIARLASKGVPLSIRSLLNNLLNCGMGGEYCEDDAYSSFLELKQDLSLMIADPSRFLEDIQVSNGLPTLEVCDKLYERENEAAKLEQLYQEHMITRAFKGVIISGGAGVGKSHLAMHIKKLTSKANGYFGASKFQQNNMHLKPLSIIGNLFSELCERFASDSSPLQLKSVSDELENALGNQARLLAGVVPSLSKVMPSCIYMEGTSSACVDATSSMRYLFGELLRVISSHSTRPISFFIDDIQFADSSSLLLISDLLFTIARPDSSVFFVFCHRDYDPDNDAGVFDIWLSSISMYSLEDIKLNNVSIEGVNNLVSDALHLSPRITLELSSVIHHKTLGNPLFVRQLLVSLSNQGCIYVDLTQPRWAWDLKKIADQEISESVLALLVKEMKGLSTDLRLGLKVASCLGSCVQKNVLEILSIDLEVDLLGILRQVSEKGYIKSVNDGASFQFAHDNIQQAGKWFQLVSLDINVTYT